MEFTRPSSIPVRRRKSTWKARFDEDQEKRQRGRRTGAATALTTSKMAAATTAQEKTGMTRKEIKDSAAAAGTAASAATATTPSVRSHQTTRGCVANSQSKRKAPTISPVSLAPPTGRSRHQPENDLKQILLLVHAADIMDLHYLPSSIECESIGATNESKEVALVEHEDKENDSIPSLEEMMRELPKPLLPCHEKAFFSGVWWKWRQLYGQKFDKALREVETEEKRIDQKTATKGKRKINIKSLSKALKRFLKFLYPKRKNKTTAKAVCEVIFHEWNEDMSNIMNPLLTKFSKKHLKKYVFPAWKFCKAIDMKPTGSLNLSALNNIRDIVEELGLHEQGLIPEASTVSRCAKSLEKFAEDEFGLVIEVESTDHGPMYTFDFKTLLRFLVERFGLEEYAVTGAKADPVRIPWTIDGAMLTAYLGFVLFGPKIADTRAINPMTGKPIVLFQSRNYCFPAGLLFGRDCKALYTCIGPFFNFVSNPVCPAILDSNGNVLKPELSNFEPISSQDLCSFFKTTGLGGGSFTAFNPCPYCMVGRGCLSNKKAGNDRCHLCKECDCRSCWCWPVVDDELLKEIDESLEEYQANVEDGFRKLDDIVSKSKLDTNPETAHKEKKSNHIDYFYSLASKKQKATYRDFLLKELKLRLSKLQFKVALKQKDLELLRLQLRGLATEEKELQDKRATVGRYKSVNLSFASLKVQHAIFCILHMRMRVSEKIFYSLLNQMLSRYAERCDSSVRKSCVAAVEACMKERVLGDVENGRINQWSFPFTENKKRASPRTLTGEHAARCMSGLTELADEIFQQEFDQSGSDERKIREDNEKMRKEWHNLMDVFLPMMELAEQRPDFTEEDNKKLHCLANRFMDVWCGIFTNEHVTNYIHIIGSGHMYYFIKRYRNLYRFSQQGLEALIQQNKHFYFHNTNHGGCMGRGEGKPSGEHCKPLMQLMQ